MKYEHWKGARTSIYSRCPTKIAETQTKGSITSYLKPNKWLRAYDNRAVKALRLCEHAIVCCKILQFNILLSQNLTSSSITGCSIKIASRFPHSAFSCRCRFSLYETACDLMRNLNSLCGTVLIHLNSAAYVGIK